MHAAITAARLLSLMANGYSGDKQISYKKMTIPKVDPRSKSAIAAHLSWLAAQEPTLTVPCDVRQEKICEKDGFDLRPLPWALPAI